MSALKFPHDNNNVNDAVLSIINDGNGELCGADYQTRCTWARNSGLIYFRAACRAYSRYRVEVFKSTPLRRTEIVQAASELLAYYEEHVKDIPEEKHATI